MPNIDLLRSQTKHLWGASSKEAPFSSLIFLRGSHIQVPFGLLPPPCLLFLSLRAASLRTAELVSTGSSDNTGRLLLANLGPVVIRDPFLLVTTCSSSSDSDGFADGRLLLGFLGLRNEGEVGTVSQTTEKSRDDKVGREAIQFRRSQW